MSTRPTVPIPAWATTGPKVQPSAGKIAQGWLVNERPPAEWWNWIDNAAGQWLQFFQDVTSGQPIPDLFLKFAQANNLQPLIDSTVEPGSNNYKLLLRAQATTTIQVHLYVANSGARKFLITYNALWDGAWHCMNTGQVATAIAVVQDAARSACELLYHPASASSWADSAWQRGNILLQDVTAVTLNATTLAATTVNAGTVNASAAVHAAALTVDASGTATIDCDLTVNAKIFCTDKILTTGLQCQSADVEFTADVDITYLGATYAELPLRHINLPISQGVPWDLGGAKPVYHQQGYWSPGASSNPIEFPFSVPRGCPFFRCYAVYRAAASADRNKLELWHWARSFVDDSGTGTVLPSVPADGEVLAGKFQGVFDASLPVCDSIGYGPPDTFDPTSDRYAVVVSLTPGSANRLWGVRVSYYDPGTRNG